MDFHSLTRRDLQSLCKLNKIRANLTNAAMADALQSLDIVEGVEEFLASNLVESAEKMELLSPKAPQTRCRTSTRQTAKKTESENLPPTATRTTRRQVKQLASGALKTPEIRSILRKDLLPSSCRNVNNQLNECHEQSLVGQNMDSVPNSPATVESNGKNKGSTASLITLKQENTVQEMKTYSRRSTTPTEKKSLESRVKKDSEKAVEIKSFLEEVNVVASEENVSMMESGGQVEDICNAFEKLDVLPVNEKIEIVVDKESAHKSEDEIKDCGELDSHKQESEETEQVSVNSFTETYIENGVNKKNDADSDKKDGFSVSAVPFLPTENHAAISKPTSFVSNDKENIDSGRKVPILFVDDGKKSKKENESYSKVSIRQLRKQLKAMTLKSLKSNEVKEAITTRPALQAICENKMGRGETTN